MIKEILHETSDRMHKTIESLHLDLMSIRTGRASPALVDRLSVDYYGVATPLLQLAAISIPEAQSIIIRPYSCLLYTSRLSYRPQSIVNGERRIVNYW